MKCFGKSIDTLIKAAKQITDQCFHKDFKTVYKTFQSPKLIVKSSENKTIK